MTFFKLGWRLFYKNPLLNIVIIFQITAALLLSNFLVLHMESPYMLSSLLSNLDHGPAAYVQPSPVYRHELKMENVIDDSSDISFRAAFEDLLVALPHVERVSQIIDYPVNAKNRTITIRSYDSYLADKIRFPLADGSWFSDLSPEPGMVNAVALAGHGFKTGDIFNWDVFNAKSSDASDSLPIQIKITGIVDESTYYLDFSGGGTPVYASTLFENTMTENESPLIFCSLRDMAEYMKFAIVQANALVFFEKGISENMLNQNLALLAQNCIRADLLSEMIHAGNENARKEVIAMLPVAIFIFAIGLLGLLSLMSLNTLLHRKTYAIYYLCGCRQVDCLKITAAYLFYMIVASLLLFIMAYNISNLLRIFPAQQLVTGFDHWLTTIGLLLATAGIALIIPFIIVKRSSPWQILAESGDC